MSSINCPACFVVARRCFEVAPADARMRQFVCTAMWDYDGDSFSAGGARNESADVLAAGAVDAT